MLQLLPSVCKLQLQDCKKKKLHLDQFHKVLVSRGLSYG